MANTLKFGDGKWATGEGTALAFNDENDNFKPLPFTFTRNSSATVVNQSGLIEEIGSDVPRIDFKDNTKGALLLEPARTNLLTYSSELGTNTSGTASVTSNTVISPDGTLNADTLGGGYLAKGVSATAGNYSFSVFVKYESLSTTYIYIYDGSYYIGAYDLNNGTSSGAGASIEDYGNGWYRCIITTTTASAITEVGFNTGSVYAYGIQLEAGSYATSYIPTSGSAVTRVVDAASQTLPSSVFNSYPFSVFAEVDVVNITSGYAFSLLNKASSNQYFTIEYYSNRWHMVARPSGSTVTRSSSEVLTKGTHKLVGVYTDTNLKLFLNGSLIVSGSNTQSFNSSIDSMLLGQLRISGDTGSRNSVTQALLYNTELTDQEAITLTT